MMKISEMPVRPHNQSQRLENRSLRGLVFVFIIAICNIALIFQAFAEPEVQRPDEMEFDARVIKGQRAEGAVYLFQRAARPLPPLLSYKRDYLGAIVSPVFGSETSLGQKSAARTKEKLKIGEGTKRKVNQEAANKSQGDRKKGGKNIKKWRRSKKARKTKRKSWKRRSKR